MCTLNKDKQIMIKKLLPVMVLVAMSVPSANAGVLSDAAGKVTSTAKTAVSKTVGLVKGLAGAGLNLVSNGVAVASTAAQDVIQAVQTVVE